MLFREIWIDTVCWTLSLKDKDQENAKSWVKCIGDIESRSEDFYATSSNCPMIALSCFLNKLSNMAGSVSLHGVIVLSFA